MKPVLRSPGVATATAVVASIAAAFAPPLSGQTLLRLAPPEGQESRYAFSMKMTIENPMMPPGPLILIDARLTRTVLGATEDRIRAGVAIDSFSMTSIAPGLTPQDLAGSAFTIETDPRGRLLNVVADDPEDAVTREAGSVLFESADFYRLPEAEVAAGDSWTETVPVSLTAGGPLQVADVEVTYTLSTLADGQATIAFSGPVEASLAVVGMPADMSGALSGSMVLDLAEGRFVRRESLLKLDVVTGGMTMPTEMTTTLELVTAPN